MTTTRRRRQSPLPPPVPALAEWIVSSASDGDMRLVVASAPPWPDAVFRAAALVERLDALHRADSPDAQVVADELDQVITLLRWEGIEAWLAS